MTTKPPQASGSRPGLIPGNRKLRHVRGVFFRNLNLAPRSSRARGKTIDDEVVPSRHRSALSLLESPPGGKLPHVRSHDDLRASNALLPFPEDNHERPSPHDGLAFSTPVRKTRRRSTVDYLYSSPRQRQLRIEASIANRLADLFFSIHVPGQNGSFAHMTADRHSSDSNLPDPVYISEVARRTMNPIFRLFDLTTCAPSITRMSHFKIRIWANRKDPAEWRCLVEETVYLSALQFLGKELENYHYQLPDNCIIFQLVDGLYISSSENIEAARDHAVVHTIPATPQDQLQLTSGYDDLMRLLTLDDCIQDAQATQERVKSQIAALLADDAKRGLRDDKAREKDSLKLLREAIKTERRQLKAVRNTRDGLRSSLEARRKCIKEGRVAHVNGEAAVDVEAGSAVELRAANKKLSEDMTGQRRRICEDLLSIYPIDAIPHKPLAFTIRGLGLPNSSFEKMKDDNLIGAALGSVAHLVYLLSFYLSTPLPYPLQPFSSTSVIADPISLMVGNHTFPLYLKGTLYYRFEYAVFLLNKNIELLSAKLGLAVVDIRQTLPNLKYLLYVATAGKGELPTRKAGGVRAFLRDSSHGSVASSRRGSNESIETKHAQLLRKQALAPAQ